MAGLKNLPIYLKMVSLMALNNSLLIFGKALKHHSQNKQQKKHLAFKCFFNAQILLQAYYKIVQALAKL